MALISAWLNAMRQLALIRQYVVVLKKSWMKQNEIEELGVKVHAVVADVIQVILLKRLGQAEEIGQVAVFLSSPLVSYITGIQIVCGGGMNLVVSALFNMGVNQSGD